MTNPSEVERMIKEQVQAEMERSMGVKAALKDEAAGTLGFLGGAGVGLALVDPINAFNERRVVRREHAASQLAGKERQVYSALREIHLGTATFEDYGEAADLLREYYKDENIRRMIADPRAFKQTMDGLNRGNVVDMKRVGDADLAGKLRGIRKEHIKRALPFGGGLQALPGNLAHPAVAFGGLLGIAGGHALHAHMQKKDV